MKTEELRLKTEDQLKTDLTSIKKEALNLRFQQAGGQLENTARMRTVRRNIAQIKTFLVQKANPAAAQASAVKPAGEKAAKAGKTATKKPAAKKTAKAKA